MSQIKSFPYSNLDGNSSHSLSNLDDSYVQPSLILVGHPNVKMDRQKETFCIFPFIFGCPNSKMDSNHRVNA